MIRSKSNWLKVPEAAPVVPIAVPTAVLTVVHACAIVLKAVGSGGDQTIHHAVLVVDPNVKGKETATDVVVATVANATGKAQARGARIEWA